MKKRRRLIFRWPWKKRKDCSESGTTEDGRVRVILPTECAMTIAREADPKPVIVYKIRNKNLCVADLPTDVFRSVCERLDRDFFSHSQMFRAYNSRQQLQSLSVGDALFKVAEREVWTVEDFVKTLIKVDNRLAIRELVVFWPAHFVKKPDRVIAIQENDDLIVDADAAGIPPPSIFWYDEQSRRVGSGNQLWLNHVREGFYTVTAQNEYKKQTYSERIEFRVNIIPQPPTSPVSEASNVSGSARQVHDYPHPSSTQVKGIEGPAPLAKQKVALLIGMTNYCEETQLCGPYQDLPNLAKALSKINFRVITLLNLPLEDLQHAIDVYAHILGEGVYGFLYLSGHGQRFPGIDDDFLIPVDAPNEPERTDCLSRKQTIGKLQKLRPAFNLVVWDACRTVQRPENGNSDDEEPEQAVSERYVQPPTFKEDNLYQFCSSVYDRAAYEVSGEKRSSSLTVIKFLELFDEGRKEIGDFLKGWAKLIYQQTLGIQGQRSQMCPIFIVSNPCLSLWDPVAPQAIGRDSTSPVQQIWNSWTMLDANQIYALPQVVLEPEIENIGIHVRPSFHMHNVLRLSVSCRTSPQLKAGIIASEMIENLVEDFENGSELSSPDWASLKFKDSEEVVSGVYRKVFIFHLQRFRDSSERAGPRHSLRVPIVVENPRGGWWTSMVIVKDIPIIQLFSALRATLT